MASQATATDMTAYRAPSLFQPHRVRQAIRDAHEGKIPPMLGLYLGPSSVVNARFVAPLGFDAVWIDWEHFSCNVETMTDVRVPGHDHASIGYALDAGASIVIPQVNTVAEAQHCVSAAKYGTKQRGRRSAPPFRLIPGVTATPLNRAKYLHENLNEQAAIMIQIETQEGVDNLDDILTHVPDINAVWFGILDLRVSMNLVGTPWPGPEPEYVATAKKFEEVLRKHDKPRGGNAFGDPEMVKYLGKDNAISFVAADVKALSGLRATLGTVRQMFPAERKMRAGVGGVGGVGGGGGEKDGEKKAKDEVKAVVVAGGHGKADDSAK